MYMLRAALWHKSVHPTRIAHWGTASNSATCRKGKC